MGTIHDWFTRGSDGYDLWNTYGNEDLALNAKKELEEKGYKVKIKVGENSRHVVVWNVYYRYRYN